MTLRQRLTAPDILIAPGVYDGLTAALATDAGFEALYLSGAAVAYTRLGRPDIGLSTASEMTDTMALIADRTDLPVIMDADTGFGNALNARRTMQSYERAGASALQVEDQTYPKKCGHLSDKSLISKEEMAGKIAAMATRLAFCRLGIGKTRFRIVSRETLGVTGGVVLTDNLRSFFIERYSRGEKRSISDRTWYVAPAEIAQPEVRSSSAQRSTRKIPGITKRRSQPRVTFQFDHHGLRL
ncbi:isocitrate lyase/PEP mutase family protein, partial [uncultured Sulfitobacter sp.]|uniref:isocitrate lyase/PEP mutase family protein n=1 Tax=uncultured Sulfitobacter sp. TaxID=191468 RepID=UPI00259A5BB0